MRDRFFRGLLAGLAGSVVKDGLDFLMHYAIRFNPKTFLDFSGVLVLGHRPKGLWELLLAYVGQLIFSSSMGILFVYLTSTVMSSRRLYLKGAFFGVTVWFFTYAIAIMLRVPALSEFSPRTASTHLVTTCFFGLTLAAALHYFEKKG